MNKREMVSGMFCAVIAAAVALPALAQAPAPKQVTAEELKKAKPTASVEIDQKEFSLIIGGTQGKGVLTFQGKTYPFTLKGLSAGASVGMTKVHASGHVYFLNKVEDFAGRFSAVGASAAAVKGAGVASYQNNKGVYLRLVEKSTGAELALGVSSFDVQFVK
jgi:hypothetical protein